MKSQSRLLSRMTLLTVPILMRSETGIILNNYVFNLSFPKKGINNCCSKKEFEMGPAVPTKIPQEVQGMVCE